MQTHQQSALPGAANVSSEDLGVLTLPRLTPSRLLVVGCGPAAQRNYFSQLNRVVGTEFERVGMLVELEAARERVTAFTNGCAAAPRESVWLPDSHRTSPALPEALVAKLDRAVASGEINGAMILTEPKAHLPYLEWAMSRSLPVLLEKPLSAPSGACTTESGARELWDDYLRVAALVRAHPESPVTLMAQRRAHAGFQFVMEQVRELARAHEIPVTFADVFKSDGLWTFPHEYGKENHPFKYGYGMLLHGGYHFIDLLAQVLDAGAVPGKEADSMRTNGMFCWPDDALGQIDTADYARLFPGYDGPDADLSAMGDLDTHALFELRRGERAVTHAKLTLMHNGFSRRAWPLSKADTYKGNGRVRHERLHLSFGPLASIMVHSYSAFEEHERTSGEVPPQGEPGGHDHFDVQLFRNSALIGGKPFESFSLSDVVPPIESSHIQDARSTIIRGFLRGEQPLPWERYELSFRMLSELALCAARHRSGRSGTSECALGLSEESRRR